MTVTTTKKQEETPSIPPPTAKVEEGNGTLPPASVPESVAQSMTTDAGNLVDVVGGGVDSSQEGAGAGSSVPVSDVVFPTTVDGAETMKMTSVLTTDGVSMDNAGVNGGATFDTQVDSDRKDSMHSKKLSLSDRLKGVSINNNDLRSPAERASSPASLLGSLWSK